MQQVQESSSNSYCHPFLKYGSRKIVDLLSSAVEKRLINISVVPRQNNDSRESEKGQPWKNWNCQNHSQNCLSAIFVHEIVDFPKNPKINVTINTNILFPV